MRNNSIKHKTTSSFNLSSNGQAEDTYLQSKSLSYVKLRRNYMTKNEYIPYGMHKSSEAHYTL